MWSNLFKYSLLLHQYDIAYNAIICNPDEQRYYILIDIVLYYILDVDVKNV